MQFPALNADFFLTNKKKESKICNILKRGDRNNAF